MLNRRNILLGGVSLLGLAGCSGGLSGAVGGLPQYAQDAQTIATALQQVVSDVGAIQGVPSTAIAKVQGAIAQLTSLAGQIGSAASGLAGQMPSNLLGSFGQLALNVVSGLGGTSATGTLGTVLQGVMSVLPVILSVAGIALAPQGGMSPAEGRSVLHMYISRAK